MSHLDKKAIFEDRSQVKTARRIQALIGEHHPEVAWHLKRVLEIASTPITLAVMGEFSAGKSTFINRLLGIDALPVSILPKTATITRLLYGETPRIEIEYATENERFIREEEGYDGLKKIQNAKKISDSDFKKEIGSIREVRVYASNPLLKKFTLLDTPGFNHDASMDEKTMAALCDAHIIVWLSDYTQLAKRTEFERIAQLREHNKRIHLIINKTDVHVSGTDSYQQTEAEVKAQLHENRFIELFCSKEIYLISCKTELPFWDGMFQQFLSRFGRAVLDEDITISIALIASQWEKLKDSIHKEQAQHEVMKRNLESVNEMLVAEAFVAEHIPSALAALEIHIGEISEELLKHCERASKLCTSPVIAANRFVRELLMSDLYERFIDMESSYCRMLQDIHFDFFRKRRDSLTHLARSITDQESWELRMLSMIIEHQELQESTLLDLRVLPKATIEAVELIDLFCCQVRGELGDFVAEVPSRLRFAMKHDLEHDLRDIVSDRSLGLVLQRLEQNLVEGAVRLSKSLTLMEA